MLVRNHKTKGQRADAKSKSCPCRICFKPKQYVVDRKLRWMCQTREEGNCTAGVHMPVHTLSSNRGSVCLVCHLKIDPEKENHIYDSEAGS